MGFLHGATGAKRVLVKAFVGICGPVVKQWTVWSRFQGVDSGQCPVDMLDRVALRAHFSSMGTLTTV